MTPLVSLALAVPPAAQAAGSGGVVWAGLLVAMGGFATVIVLLVGRERRHGRDRAFSEAKENAGDDLIAFADALAELEEELELPGAPIRSLDDAALARRAYDSAEHAWKTAYLPGDLEAVSMALEEGLWALRCAHARLAYDEPPVRRPPCFFDPLHGPSARDVHWTPPYGSVRPVPACAADAECVERGEEPRIRPVSSGGRQVPHWDAGPAYAAYSCGFFGGRDATLLPDILRGSALGVVLTSAAGRRRALEGAERRGGDHERHQNHGGYATDSGGDA